MIKVDDFMTFVSEQASALGYRVLGYRVITDEAGADAARVATTFGSTDLAVGDWSRNHTVNFDRDTVAMFANPGDRVCIEQLVRSEIERSIEKHGLAA